MALFEYAQECIDAANGRWPGIEPGSKRKDRPRSIRVFKNDVLEKYFAKAHWITPGIWFGWLVVFGCYRGLTDARVGVARTAGLFAAGLLIWSLVEYVLHRFLFHTLKPEPGKEGRYLLHGYHHDFPDDPMRLVMVPIGSWPLGVAWALVFYFAFGAAYFMPALAGSAAGYISYDWIHYYTHHARPTTALGKWLRQYHMRHHFQDGNSRYGVSSPLWDLVFGTFRSKLDARAEGAQAGEAGAH